MADNIETLDLTFDTKSFQQSINKMTESFQKFGKDVEIADKKRNNNMIKNAKATAESTAKGMMSAFGKIAMLGGALFGLYRGLSQVISGIPEIGATFKIAGDIFMRNFLFPLRSMLIPMLNRFLAWVRDSRMLFLAWGTVLANVFKVIFVAINTIVKAVKSLFKGFMETINQLYKGTFGNLTEFINMILFKLAMVIAFVGAKLEPLMKILGNIFAKILNNLKDFAKGFITAFMGIASKLNIMENLKNILSEISKFLEIINPAMKLLGTIIGTVLAVAFKSLLVTVELIVKAINMVAEGIAGLKFKGSEIKLRNETLTTNNVTKRNETPTTNNVTKRNEITETIKTNKVDDAIIKPNGEIIKTNPMDTIIAMKNPEKKLSGGEVSLNFNNVFNINGVENMKQKAVNFSSDIMEQIRKGLIEEYVLQGNR